MLRFFLSRWFWSAVGVLGLSLFIWYLSPLISFAEHRPFDSQLVRGLLIALLVLAFIGTCLWKWRKARKTNARLAEGIVAQASAARASPGSEDVKVLRQRFEEAIALLRQSARRRPGGLRRLAGNYLYELPWYMFIGAPGSGKTTALINSGLQFPLAERFGHELTGVGGTRNCDWLFTDKAVLIDTAGRYTTHESDHDSDSAAWQGFLSLLAKYRPRRPINGIILTVSAADLLERPPGELDAQARALRARVQELHERLRVRFPIYVMVSKADLLPGFMEFFGDMSREEREQVWGTTFDLGSGSENVLTEFEARFKALESRINDRLIDKLQSERDIQRRALMYAMPQHLHLLGAVLSDFLQKVFAPSRFEEQPMVRGVYLTSGTQEGSPIDRIVGGLARALRLERKVLPPQRATGKSFFITRLIEDIIFAESGIAGTNLKWERRRAALQWTAYSAAAAVTIALIAAWTVSYAGNQAYMREVDARVADVSQQVAAVQPTRSGDLIGILPILRSVRDVATTSANPNGQAPWPLSFGLYQGEKLAAAADFAYGRMLQDVMLPRIAFRIEQQLRDRGQENLELLYEGLKAYIMLSEPKRFDPNALRAYVTTEWNASLSGDVRREQRDELEAHLRRMLAPGAVGLVIQRDEQLVARTRDTIQRIPIAQRIYSRLKLHGAPDMGEFTVVREVGPSAPGVFRRQSGESLAKGVSGFYTHDGYHKVFAQTSPLVANQLAQEEPWVLGRTDTSHRATDAQSKERIIAEVRRLYLEDYRRTWDAFIKDIKLAQPRDLQEAVSLSRTLGSPDSPLPVLLRAIVREVTLGKEEEKSDKPAPASTVDSARKHLERIFATSPVQAAAPAKAGPESLVDNHFAPLRRMVRGKPAPIEGTTALMNEIHTHLTLVQAAASEGRAPPPGGELAVKVKTEAARLPEPVQSVVASLSQNATRQGAENWRVSVNKALSRVTEPCRKAIEGRYPFHRNASADVTRDDFTHLFAAGGLLDDFFQKNLTAHVDMATRPWRFRPTGDPSSFQASPDLIQFQRAQAIRETFFRGAAVPTIKLEFKPVSMDPSITQLTMDIDGQVIRYSHGPQLVTPVQWPGPKGTGQVRLQALPSTNSGGQAFEGAWALLRLLDRAQLQPTSQSEKMLATFVLDGRSAQFEVISASVQNPLRLPELTEFRCPARL